MVVASVLAFPSLWRKCMCAWRASRWFGRYQSFGGGEWAMFVVWVWLWVCVWFYSFIHIPLYFLTIWSAANQHHAGSWSSRSTKQGDNRQHWVLGWWAFLLTQKTYTKLGILITASAIWDLHCRQIHILRFETATWNSTSSPTCNLCEADDDVQDDFLFHVPSDGFSP